MFVRPPEINVRSLGFMPERSLAVLNRNKDVALILEENSKRFAVFLSSKNLSAFDSFECTGNKHWNGFFISEVAIEIDITSVSFESTSKFGFINTSDGSIDLLVNIKGDGVSDGHSIPISRGGEVTKQALSFSKWRVIRRTDKEPIVLATVDGGIVDLVALAPLGQHLTP